MSSYLLTLKVVKDLEEIRDFIAEDNLKIPGTTWDTEKNKFANSDKLGQHHAQFSNR